MLVVVSYDVSVQTAKGRRRLRRIAKVCTNYGQRVQNSVFQCLIRPDEWIGFRARLLDIYEDSEDSLRFYFLGENWHSRVEHHGIKTILNMDEPLIT